jgi:hypothetical protein
MQGAHSPPGCAVRGQNPNPWIHLLSRHPSVQCFICHNLPMSRMVQIRISTSDSTHCPSADLYMDLKVALSSACLVFRKTPRVTSPSSFVLSVLIRLCSPISTELPVWCACLWECSKAPYHVSVECFQKEDSELIGQKGFT